MQKTNDFLRSRLLEFLAMPGYQPLKDHEIANELEIRSERSEFRALLRQLQNEGIVSCIRGNRWTLARAANGLRGWLRMNLQGHGYFTPEIKSSSADLFIHKDQLGNALDGDLVLVEPLKPTMRSRRYAKPDAAALNLSTEGKIIRVIERKRSQLVGLLQQSQKYWYIIPDSPRITQNVRVSGFAPSIKVPRPGRKVVLELGPSKSLFEMLEGRCIEDLGDPNGPGVDVVSILRDRELSETFPDHVQHAADSRSVSLDAADLAGRRDLRAIPTVTIDPVDAKDFDDAVSLLRNGDGTFKLYVHIADVAHFVPMGSIVDKEALERGNSVYMVDRHVPMLPKHLTADVCSLRPHSDRLAHTVIADLDSGGNVLHVETCRAVIHSKLRLNYEQVQDFIDNKSEEAVTPNLRPMLRDMIAMSATLRDKRMRNGALDLAMPEVKIHLDKMGRATGIHRRGANEAYHVVEEFMLIANCCVAELLQTRGIPTLYRIHEAPTDEQWERMAVDLSSLGLRDKPRAQKDLNPITRRAAGTAQEYPVNLAILKNLKRAMYSPHLDIHFGLAFDCYAHFTSPIRRYADLVVHRGLCALEAKQKPPYSIEDCEKIAEHVSETERTAAEAETESLDVKRIEYYANALAQGEIGPHRAIVAGFVSRGLIVETVETLQRGLLPFASLRDDFYEFNASRGCAEGKRSRKRLTLGTEVSVTLSRVDTVKRLIDFAPAEAFGARTDRQSQPQRHPQRRFENERRNAQQQRPGKPPRPSKEQHQPQGGQQNNSGTPSRNVPTTSAHNAPSQNPTGKSSRNFIKVHAGASLVRGKKAHHRRSRPY